MIEGLHSTEIREIRRPLGGPPILSARIPRYAQAALAALQFDAPQRAPLRELSAPEYRDLLHFCDKSQLTLTLRHLHRAELPGSIQTRMDRNLTDYGERFRRLRSDLLDIAGALESRGIDFTPLKGLAHSPEYTPDPVLRTQGDIDIWCRPEDAEAAWGTLLDLGYAPIAGSESRHLPPLARPTEWKWRGDYHAPDLPISVEVHYRLWDAEMERIQLPDECDFWRRRAVRRLEGHCFQVLSPHDTLAFASLHLLMHILHGDVRLQRAWEIAHFLDRQADNEEFWIGWRAAHSERLRHLEVVVFHLVHCWFGCALPAAATVEGEALAEDTRLWLDHYSLSPIEALFHPNKDEIWLQTSLVESFRDRVAILRRRLLPVKPAFRREARGKRARGLKPSGKPYVLSIAARHAAARFAHHARTFLPTILGGARWQWRRSMLSAEFVRFQAAAVLFSLGMFVFFVLYNLYLLGLGYHEAFLGRVAACLSLGSLVGSLASAFVARRAGLRRSLNITIFGTAGAAALRTWNGGPEWLLAAAFANGVFLSVWAVSYSPALAGLTSERNRRLGFSIATALGIGTGALGGLIAGLLPRLLGHVLRLPGLVQQERLALLTAAGSVTIAAIASAGLRFEKPRQSSSKIWPRSRMLLSLLVALACWTAATGALNPFFNAFLATRLRMSVAQIGLAFASSNLFQVAAVLAAPALFKRLGDVAGIALTQAAAASALGLLAIAPGSAAPAIYVGYMGMQYVSEPAILNSLMNCVAPAERSGASALYFIMTSIVGSIAAYAGGAAISRFGYSPVFLTSGSIAVIAAFLFFALVRDQA